MPGIRPPTFLDLSLREWRITARWQVWALVVLALISATGLAWVAAYVSPWIAIGLAGMPLLLVAVATAVPRRETYPYIVLFLALFVPLSLPTGRDSRLVLSLVFTGGAFALIPMYALAFRRTLPFKRSPINLPFVAWSASVLASLAWSMAFRDVQVRVWPSFPFVQAASAFVMIMLPFALMLTAHFLNSERQLKMLVALFLFAGVVGLAPRFEVLAIPVNLGGMFNMWVIALAGSLAMFNRKIVIWQRALLAALAGIYMIWGVLLHVSWLAGWLPGVVAFAVLLANRSKFATLITGVLVVAILAASLSSVDQVIADENASSGETRLAAWAANWSITKDHLLFGTGPAGYAAYYMTYLPKSAMATHSNYIDILAETGVVGTLAYLWLWGTLIVTGVRVCHRLRDRGDFLQALANAAFAGAIACVVIMGFGDWLIPFAYTQTIMGFDYTVYNWIFIGTLFVIERLTTQPAAALGRPEA